MSAFRWIFGVIVVALFLGLGITTGEPPVLPALIISGAVVLVLWRARDRVPRFFRPKTGWGYFVVFWAILFTASAALDYTINLPIAEQERGRIVADFDSIAQPGFAQLGSHELITKPGSVLVQSTYMGAAAWVDLRSYFDRVLAADGWLFLEESNRLTGSHGACYGKGDDRAHLEVPDSPTTAGYSYAFSIDWDLHPIHC